MKWRKAAGWAALKVCRKRQHRGRRYGLYSESLHRCTRQSIKDDIKGAVSSSVASTEKSRRALVFKYYDCNEVEKLDVYVDGADEINATRDMIKGGGAALTREKIVAAISDKFVCIVDGTKAVDVLGHFPTACRSDSNGSWAYVARELKKLGGNPVYREGVVTDNGNVTFSMFTVMKITDAKDLEVQASMPLLVWWRYGLFADRGADVVITGTPEGAKIEE